jgi:5-methylcytosine-specific restriction endonuclease McrA
LPLSNAEKLRRWRAANRDKYLEQRRLYYRKHRERLLADARKQREANPEKHREATRRWYAKNRERAVQASVDWARRNPKGKRERDRRRYCRRRNAVVGPGTDERARELLKLPCAYCGVTENIEIDHIVPLSRGGNHVVENLTSACKSCNSSKGAKLLSEWITNAAV